MWPRLPVGSAVRIARRGRAQCPSRPCAVPYRGGVEYQPPPPFAAPEQRHAPLDPAALTWQAGATDAAPGWPAAGGPQPATPPTPWRLIAAAALLVAAVTVWGLVTLMRASGSSPAAQLKRISLPASVADLQLVRSVSGPTVRALLEQQLGPLGPIEDAMDTAQVGIYRVGSDGPTTVVFLGFNAADSTRIDALLGSQDADGVIDQVMSGAGAGAGAAAHFDPGPLGGALRCAQASKNGQPYTPCVWADRSTLGMVLQIGFVDTTRAANTTTQFRAAAEH